MSIEVTFFLLRLLAGLSLASFLLALFVIMWRSLKQADLQYQSTHTSYGYLVPIDAPDDQMTQTEGRFILKRITTLGRSASNTIVISDDFASAEHARIVLQDGQWWLEDRRSRNGTRLNNDAVQGRTILTDGDVIGVGRHNFRLELLN